MRQLGADLAGPGAHNRSEIKDLGGLILGLTRLILGLSGLIMCLRELILDLIGLILSPGGLILNPVRLIWGLKKGDRWLNIQTS